MAGWNDQTRHHCPGCSTLIATDIDGIRECWRCRERIGPPNQTVTPEWADKRTVMDVLIQQSTVSGCCDSHADNKGCVCLSSAMHREGMKHDSHCHRCGSMSVHAPFCRWCVELAAETRRAGGKDIPPLWKKEHPGLRIGASDKATEENQTPDKG